MTYKCNATCRDCGDVQFTEWSFGRIVRCSLCGGIMDRGGTKPPKPKPPQKYVSTGSTLREQAAGLNAYQEYLQSKKWRRVRRMALARAGHKCAECGSTENLQVHHKTYKRLFNERQRDLKVLCGDCHKIVHEIPIGMDKEAKAISG